MNKIEAILDISDYEPHPSYFNFRIDDYWLDEKLDEIYPGNEYKGLIPTLVNSLEREDQKSVVWDRILPAENSTTICPILMCPDDNDFSCTLIVAEISNCGDIIKWNKIGIDNTSVLEVESVGTSVEWFSKMNELLFTKEDYLAMLENFKDRLIID